MQRRLVLGLSVLAVLALVGTACRGASTSGANAGSSISVSGSARPSAGAANSPETLTTGDIPDNQKYATYTATPATFTLQYPDGWGRTAGTNGVVTFTDRLNSIRVETKPTPAMPTQASVQTGELPAVQSAASNFQLGQISTVQRKAGPAILVTYRADSPPDSVTGKSVRQDVERYAFWHNGTEVVLTLSAPQGSDNVDPWRVVTDSLAWR